VALSGKTSYSEDWHEEPLMQPLPRVRKNQLRQTDVVLLACMPFMGGNALDPEELLDLQRVFETKFKDTIEAYGGSAVHAPGRKPPLSPRQRSGT